jgi:hypothetical protein
MELPDDVWDEILVHHGPLALARNRRNVAARRVQRAWRRTRPSMAIGELVRWRFRRCTSAWETGRLVRYADLLCVQRLTKKRSYLFLPSSAVVLRHASG